MKKEYKKKSGSKGCKDRCIPVDVALNAAVGGAGPLPVIAIGDLTQDISVVSVDIDAGLIRDPSILIKFTTQINLPAVVEETITATLTFQVVRSSDNGTPVRIGPAFTYAITTSALSSDSFMFQLFDSDLESTTYTYTVFLTTSTVVDTAGATLINSTLSTLAVNNV